MRWSKTPRSSEDHTSRHLRWRIWIVTATVHTAEAVWIRCSTGFGRSMFRAVGARSREIHRARAATVKGYRYTRNLDLGEEVTREKMRIRSHSDVGQLPYHSRGIVEAENRSYVKDTVYEETRLPSTKTSSPRPRDPARRVPSPKSFLHSRIPRSSSPTYQYSPPSRNQ